MRVLRLPARRIALVLVFALLNQAFFPTFAWALTSGPTQPEASAFTPAGTSDMVDLFSGDFHYNIPLLDVGGYPINIAYNAGAGMDEEASWVGLGWSLNPGAINRQMRGIPDDFRGDSIYKSFHMRPDITTGVNVGGAVEFAGTPLKLSASLGLYYNTYRGYGLTTSIAPTLALSKFGKTSMSASLGLKYDTQNGLDISPALGFSLTSSKITNSINASTGINSKRGLRDLSISYNANFSFITLASARSDISFSGSTYTPTSELPLKNNSFTFHGSVGFEFSALNPSIMADGYRSTQQLSQDRQKQAAFGYLHSQLAKPSDVMDFNRERNGLPWREHMPVLPLAFGTNDLFAASGQGASGQFRAIRSDIGYFRDALRSNESDSKSFGIEVGGGNIVKLGADVNITNVTAKSQGWADGSNPMAKTAGFTDWDGKSIYEPVFFKNSGEMTMSDSAFISKIGETRPAYSDIESSSGAIRTIFQFSSNQQPAGSRSFNADKDSTIRRGARERRNDVWQFLDAQKAGRYALDKRIISYKKGKIRLSKDVDSCAVDERLSRARYKKHHISEVTIVKPDGARYIYGLPAYNVYQKEVSFSVNVDTVDNGSGLIKYNTGDDSLKNNQGRDQYFNAEVMPAYAYAFMLTGVVSPDYIDRTGDGITSDDYGTAVRINYSKNKNLFKWRTPYGKNPDTLSQVARYQPGRKSDKRGKKASYIYGTKEIWYVHSIESATMVAQFHTSNRHDGLGVKNKDGGMDTTGLSRLQKLDKIELYSKADLQKNGNNATPIKTVHFLYSYELCPGALNSDAPGDKGKLTLKKIWFTYGKSGRGELNAYDFAYNNGPKDPTGDDFAYNMVNIDRWGNYKIHPDGYPNNNDFPYALQDETVNTTTGVKASIHDYAGAWCLSEITLPSGGTISVEYESDDYAYVQNKRAGQMYFIRGFSRDSLASVMNNMLYTGLDDADMSCYVWIDIESLNLPDTTLPNINAFKTRCLQGIDNIYFNMDVRMAQGSKPFLNDKPRERITGYMEYDKSLPLKTLTIGSDQNYPAVGIPVKIVKTDKNDPIHPVTQAALQTMRLELPDLAYPGSEAETGFEAVIKGMVGAAQSILDIFKGFEANKMKKGDAKYVEVAGADGTGAKASWIRLCNARFKKFGGGHRVKKISLNDIWNTMASGQPEAIYGQQYSYTTRQKVKIGNAEQNLLISSGVASWEPTIGNEENLWKEPVTYNERIKLAPDNSYYIEKPFGESLFPAPMVGYSEVKVQSLGYKNNKRSGSGWTIEQYYTAKDFPTLVDYSIPIRHKNQYKKLSKFFNLQAQDHLALSQGFVIEVNDMHGKMKETASYAQNGALISSTSYEYKVDNPDNVPLHLNNKVKVAAPDGSIGAEKLLGTDIEIWQDFREESTLTEGAGFAGNTDAFFPGGVLPWPFVLFMGKPLLSREDVRFRSAVTTKFVKRTGILSKVTKRQDGSTITTENLLWDSETGAILATKTQNEFEDPIYQFTYPAHWVSAYGGMGMAYKNSSTQLTRIFFHNGKPYLASGASAADSLPNYSTMFTNGDEFGLQRFPSKWKMGDDTLRLTTYVVGSELKFYTDQGKAFSSASRAYDLYMLRPGRRNQAGTSVGTITSKKNPLAYSTIQAFASDADNQIVNASVATFSDLWQGSCNCSELSTGDTINPYRHGIKGNWRMKEAYANHQQRRATKMLTSLGTTNIRKDGTIPSFVPFWEYVSDKWQPDLSNPEWIRQSTVNTYDAKGNATEERDALGIYSSAYYGYQGNLNIAVAHNTRLRQGICIGFEDYNYDISPSCEDTSSCDLVQFVGDGYDTGTISDSVAHTGKYSFRMEYGFNVLPYTFDSSTSTSILTNHENKYALGRAGCIPSLNPPPGTYLFSAWINTGGACNKGDNDEPLLPSIAITQQFASFPLDLQVCFPSGPVIDGWQRIFSKVEIDATSGGFEIRVLNPLNKPVYFDDIRFHPWNGNMKSFVYDPVSLRLMATLDENNYATFYEYDDEGMLIRVKRETERGIMTVEEHRSALKY